MYMCYVPEILFSIKLEYLEAYRYLLHVHVCSQFSQNLSRAWRTSHETLKTAAH